MKKLLIAFLMFTTVAFGQSRPAYNDLKGSFGTTLTQAKVNSLVAVNSKFFIAETLTVAESVTFPSSATVEFAPGGKLNIASGVVVTFECPFSADAFQIFTGEGADDIVISSALPLYGLCEWWGGGPGVSGTINQPAMQAALNITRNLKLGRGFYYVTSGLIIPSSASIVGEGPNLTVIITGTAASEMIKTSNYDAGGIVSGLFLKDFTLNGGGLANWGMKLGDNTLVNAQPRIFNSTIEDVTISECKNGIDMRGSTYNSLLRCKIGTTGANMVPTSQGLVVDYSQGLDVEELIVAGFATNINVLNSSTVHFKGGNSYADDATLPPTTSLLTVTNCAKVKVSNMLFEWNIASSSQTLVTFASTGAGEYETTDCEMRSCYLMSLDNPPASGKAMIQIGGTAGNVKRTRIEDCYFYPIAAAKEHIRLASASVTLLSRNYVGSDYADYDAVAPTIYGELGGAYSRTFSQTIGQLDPGGRTSFGVGITDLSANAMPLVSSTASPGLELTPYIDTLGSSGIVGIRVENLSGGIIPTATVDVTVTVIPGK